MRTTNDHDLLICELQHDINKARTHIDAITHEYANVLNQLAQAQDQAFQRAMRIIDLNGEIAKLKLDNADLRSIRDAWWRELDSDADAIRFMEDDK